MSRTVIEEVDIRVLHDELLGQAEVSGDERFRQRRLVQAHLFVKKSGLDIGKSEVNIMITVFPEMFVNWRRKNWRFL
jgi:hypothetical protein